MRHLARHLTAALALLVAPLAAAATEFVVIVAAAADYAPGDVVSGPVTLAAGESLTLMRQDGRRIELVGPHQGPAADATEASSGAFGGLAEMLRRDPMAVRLGVDRSGDGPASGLDLIAGGDWCATGVAPTLALPTRAYDRLLTLTPAAGGDPLEAVWPAYAAQLPWPDAQPPAVGQRYLARVDGVVVGGFAIVAAPTSEADLATQAVAYDKAGCASQARAALTAFVTR